MCIKQASHQWLQWRTGLLLTMPAWPRILCYSAGLQTLNPTDRCACSHATYSSRLDYSSLSDSASRLTVYHSECQLGTASLGRHFSDHPADSCGMAPKRKAALAAARAKKGRRDVNEEDEEEKPSFSELDTGSESQATEVDSRRVRVLKHAQHAQTCTTRGPVVYWVSRDQRCHDNWALLYAVQQADKRGVPLAVAFNLVDSFLHAQARHFGFLLRGLRVMEKNLRELGIPFFLFRGNPDQTVPQFVHSINASLLVTDFSPLRIGRVWRDEICAALLPGIAVHEVDAHNVVPVWITSEKLEYSARTIRTKIQKLLPEFLIDLPRLERPSKPWVGELSTLNTWDQLIEDVLSQGAEVPEVDWCEPGEDAAREVLLGPKNGFLSVRIKNYEQRNDPSKPSSLSGLSPYLHYGHISAQRCAFEARKVRKTYPKPADIFLEELVVRRELAENYCYYQPYYDNINGAWEWARKTLLDHAGDKRECLYTGEQLEKAKTRDLLWNAAQLEMVHYGKMHGFMRMYWAKKILEWTSSPQEALRIAIYLNDKYELDGRDPNGYVGCMWSICGVHDQGWGERPVFGKIRYMNYAGCKRKFDVEGYIAYVNRITNRIKHKARGASGIDSYFKPSV